MELTFLPLKAQAGVRSLLAKYTSVFSSHKADLGCTNLIAHDNPLVDDVPIRQHYRRIPSSEYEKVKQHINQLLATQVICKRSSPYASPIVLVGKKNGSLRMCVDYRQLVSKTRKDAWKRWGALDGFPPLSLLVVTARFQSRQLIAIRGFLSGNRCLLGSVTLLAVFKG